MRTRAALTILASVVAILLSFSGLPRCPLAADAQPSAPIKVGLIANLTGSAVRTSVAMLRGAEIAVSEVNAGSKIKGRPLQLVSEDSENRVQAALDAAHKLIDINGIKIILMFGGSSLMIPVAKYAKTRDVIVINTASSSPKLASFPGTLFSILPLDNIVGEALGDWVYARGFRRAAFIVPNNAFGLGLQDAAAAAFAKHGGTVAVKMDYTEGQPDYRTDLQSVVQAKPDVIVSGGFGDDTRTIFKNARELDLTAPWYTAYPTIFDVENKSWMNGKLFGLEDGAESLTNPVTTKLVRTYKAKYHEDPLPNAYYSYDGVWLVALAMRQAGPGVDAVRKALPQVVKAYTGATGKIQWDASGQRINAPLDKLAYQDGKFVLIK
jgi:branched-chain amino acid transport system substrate-binding protein